MDVKSSQVTGNAASLTSRNAKGSDLFCSNDAETIFFGVQSKGLTKRDPVGLGTNLDNLRSDWWIITIKATTDAPTCFIMKLQDVKDLAHRSDPLKSRASISSIWLQPSSYDQPQFREAWHRFEPLGSNGVPKSMILPA